MDLKYREVTCCPMCGRKGRLIMQISSGIKDTVTQGTFTGSGVGLGLGMGGIGLGVGYGGGSIQLQSVTSTRLQRAVDEPEIEDPGNVSAALRYILNVMLLGGSGLFLASCGPNLVGPNTGSDAGHQIINQLLEMMSYIGNILGYLLIGICAIWALFMFPFAVKKDREEYEQHEKYREIIGKYYETLRYCDSCHVVYDKEGYAATAREGAVIKLVENAGILADKPIQNQRLINIKL